MTSSKQCGRCNEDKPLEAFYANPSCLHGRMNACIECQAVAEKGRERRRREKGPVPKDHVCPVCELRRAIDGYSDWHLDHDHDTGVTRDYLCRGCNINLDRYVGTHRFAAAAARYLRLYESAHLENAA